MVFDGLSVHIAVPTHRDLPPPVVQSLLETQELLIRSGVSPVVEFHISSLVHHSRSLAANSFLNGDRNRLFWIDSDVSWDARDFVRLLMHSRTVDVVCGVYPRRRDGGGYFVKLGNRTPDENGLMSIKGTGLGFCCVTREVIEHLSRLAPRLKFPGLKEPIPHIFRCDHEGDEVRGEDGAFFADCLSAGFAVRADPNVRLTHWGTKGWSGRLIEVLTV
jgi:hypothetical protein